MSVLRPAVDSTGVHFVYGSSRDLQRFGGVIGGTRLNVQRLSPYTCKHIVTHNKAMACSLLHRHCIGYDL